jgi:hypothetical protein
MELVIDAQIVKSYFMESVLDKKSELTETTLPVFNRLGSSDHVYLDSDGQIQHEWKNLVDPTWFDEWYYQLLLHGAAHEISVKDCKLILRALKQYGFPVHGNRDGWYIKTAKAVSEKFGRSIILSEDMHFFEPSEKASTGVRRRKILVCCKGKVAKHLRNREQIQVHCVASYVTSSHFS